jgi:AGZA family xanthine/uracil permease-like MFS transporter
MPGSRSFPDRKFGLSEHTNVQAELIAGLTTFLTMIYIVFVNPMILTNASMDKGAVFVATCVACGGVHAGDGALLSDALDAFSHSRTFTVVLIYKYSLGVFSSCRYSASAHMSSMPFE